VSQPYRYLELMEAEVARLQEFARGLQTLNTALHLENQRLREELRGRPPSAELRENGHSVRCFCNECYTKDVLLERTRAMGNS
jgi:regulator of replication initiation timing